MESVLFPKEVLFNKEVSAIAKVFYVYIRSGEGHKRKVALRRVGEYLNISPQTAMKAVRELKEAKLIEVEKGKRDITYKALI